MATPPSHFITETVHRDAKQPRFESTAFLVFGKLLHDRAERRLNDLLGQIVVAALGPNHCMHSWRASLDDVTPCLLVPRSCGGDQSNELLWIGVVHA